MPPLDSFPLLGFCADCYEPQYECPSGPVCENGHGGADTLSELPRCRECNADLKKPDAKFCAECGASTEEPEPEESAVRDVSLCPACDSSVEEGAKFCAGCGHKLIAEDKPKKSPVEADDKKVKIPPKREEKPASKEKTVKMPKPEPEEGEETDGPEEEFDFGEIDPEKEWECFGSIEPDHVECKECPYREKCAKKSGVEL